MFSLNFILGGLFGTVSTYIYKDEQAKEWVLKTGKQFKENTQSLIASVRKKPLAKEVVVEASLNTTNVADVVVEK